MSKAMDDSKKEYKSPQKYPFISILDKLKLDLNNWDRKLTDAELEYMFDRFTHIQIVTPSNPKLPTYNPPKIINSRSGWAILNYGNAIASSPGDFLFNYAGQPQYEAMKKKTMASPSKESDDDEGGTDIGTLSKQRFITAEDIVAEALKNGWDSIHIVDGDPKFIWAIWVHAQEKNIAVTGYKFNKNDQERRERVYRSQLQDQLHRKGLNR
jgi:hypothetical protein